MRVGGGEASELDKIGCRKHRKVFTEKRNVQLRKRLKIFTKVEFHYMCSPQSLQATRHSGEAATQATENGETACLSVAK